MKYDGVAVGAILRTLRKNKGVTFEEMSDETGISVSSLKQYENGGRRLSIRSTYVLIDYLGVDANTILNVPKAGAVISIDEKLMQLDKQKREYLQQMFLTMLDHEMAS